MPANSSLSEHEKDSNDAIEGELNTLGKEFFIFLYFYVNFQINGIKKTCTKF
jgi:hypothetical protein